MILTPAQIKKILKEEKLSISKRRGQNFLVDAYMKDKIIKAIDIKETEDILEIGPGLGALTDDLADKSARVVAIEKDRALAHLLQKNLAKCKNLKVIHEDILETDLADLGRKVFKVVGNLPYYITTPIIIYLLEKERMQVHDIYVTLQEEVGRRLAAKRGTKDYASISVLVQYYTNPKLLFTIPKRAFYPQPKVNSVFVHFSMLVEPPVQVHSEEQFFKIVRACFNQRRKTILNSLFHKLKNIKKDDLHNILRKAGIDSARRPEELSIQEFAIIENIFHTKEVWL
ncbi:MAG: 16S rRNA (adenine(1518)-N(6)/adenine(1519)-N(6))-dimethyltransferase RsmA [Candidatus Omnitrophica bacterium]|nr:16S rRNA (adenine(1518)-N(6)/adenine(1519)-N(6))-dimethyltransferase RsmA [Candidatus Omnitrophota bacterium]